MLTHDYAINDTPKDLCDSERMINAIETVRAQPRAEIITGLVHQFNLQEEA